MTTKKLTLVALLVALYVIVSGSIRIPVINHIIFDLGYVVFGLALVVCDLWGAVAVGCVSVALESMLFSFSGLSITWMISNFIVAIIGKYFYNLSKKTNKELIYIVGLLISCVVAFMLVKTLLDSLIYQLPLIPKLIRNLVACLMDFVGLVIGSQIAKRYFKKLII